MALPTSIKTLFYRNRRIGEFLKELHLTDGRNTGFKKIIDALKRNGSPLPEFETDESHDYYIGRRYHQRESSSRSMQSLKRLQY